MNRKRDLNWTQKQWENFVNLWQHEDSTSAQIVADKIGITKLQAQSRSELLRRKGVKLKKMVRTGTVDFAALRKLVK